MAVPHLGIVGGVVVGGVQGVGVPVPVPSLEPPLDRVVLAPVLEDGFGGFVLDGLRVWVGDCGLLAVKDLCTGAGGRDVRSERRGSRPFQL